jgi:hypothetical protein
MYLRHTGHLTCTSVQGSGLAVCSLHGCSWDISQVSALCNLPAHNSSQPNTAILYHLNASCARIAENKPCPGLGMICDQLLRTQEGNAILWHGPWPMGTQWTDGIATVLRYWDSICITYHIHIIYVTYQWYHIIFICYVTVSYRFIVALVSLQSDLISWRSWAPIINLVAPCHYDTCAYPWAGGCRQRRCRRSWWLRQRRRRRWRLLRRYRPEQSVDLAWGLEPRTAVLMILMHLVMMMSLRGRCFSPAGDITIRVNANSSES